jgi:hypothetical protein
MKTVTGICIKSYTHEDDPSIEFKVGDERPIVLEYYDKEYWKVKFIAEKSAAQILKLYEDDIFIAIDNDNQTEMILHILDAMEAYANQLKL